VKTSDLKATIRALLTTHNVTVSQLHALLNTDENIRAIKLSEPRLRQILRAMVASGEIVKTYEPYAMHVHRYHALAPRYGCRASGAEGSTLWHVYRSGDCEVIIGYMTEPEASVCVTALNAHDRKERKS
jgi:hypothetical protein